MLITDLERLRNTLLAARQSVLLAGADGAWLHGYESALVTVAVAFGIALEFHLRPTVRMFDDAEQLRAGRGRVDAMVWDRDNVPHRR